MKLKQITILKKPVLLVDGLPAGAKFHITEEGILIYEVDGVKEVLQNAPPIREFVEKIGELTEDNVLELVERVDPWAALKWYRDYFHDDNFLNPVYSFLSSLKSEGVLFKNPFGDQEDIVVNAFDFDKFHEDMNQWQAAESNVFSKDTLIFIQK
ncbi:hypothetical protein ACFS6H_20040 [Terrimonas rubra]|uniref:Uncharacterized protein n=1 Tax=Terrimonas rubra TaxID=1035890 RepID=A0ABW6ADI7_9BACT